MLDNETKRRIDSARDILVGKVPDPKSQVEHITIAMIYKFMDDMDAESEELGGKRKFFAGEFARYGWAKLMRSGLGGHETLNLYAEAIAKMPENPGIPLLFRDIFKNAYLPYRDPETLRSFLKIIDEFSYDHSERLGDAFEYLLSVLGSQGDAGQFRTPRHIIDFMVAVVDPRKNESVLDPACGTAGFLISSYKHIVKANTDENGHGTLTPDEKGRLAQNFRGYDISPDMVRLSLVNMYLHGFTDPHIYEYDTLTSQDRWNDFADVILANPPFMSPKGGIKPHNRFSVQSNRSEVLFVDYMAEHLTPKGRAAIIVPEGIIFQGQNAYKDLRKMLVDEYLVAVVSLPAGIFQPYSGVKTSVLILDRSLARKTNTIGFFKVENDGFGLGAQRRPIDKNDLPQVQVEIKEYMRRLQAGDSVDDFQPSLGLVIERTEISTNGEYNLSGERYRDNGSISHSFPLVSLGDATLFRVESGGTPKSDVEEFWNGGIPWATLVDLPPTDFITDIKSTQRTISERGLRGSSAKIIPENSVIVSTRATIGRIAVNHIPMATNQGFKNIVIQDVSRVLPRYVALALTKLVPTMDAWASGGTFKEISKSKFCELQIPLPPMYVQKEIVAEIEGYQRVIDGARAVVDGYRPHIPVRADWPILKLDDICTLEYGFTESAAEVGEARFIRITDISKEGKLRVEAPKFITLTTQARESLLTKGDILVARTGATYGKTMLFEEDYPAVFASFLIRLRFPKDLLHPRFYWAFAQSDSYWNQAKALVTGGGQPQFNGNALKQIKIAIPPLATQQAIVDEIEAEQALVNTNHGLVSRFQNKIQATLAHLWGEE
ncbi:MAG: N-6 DNA methylase [Peptococcaceae bacterium]|nr:N-6 DNA methylase [Peptococcaceae bacterium]